jgi:hypothetical protein
LSAGGKQSPPSGAGRPCAKSRAAIRRHFTRDELKQYARLRRLKPECIVED